MPETNSFRMLGGDSYRIVIPFDQAFDGHKLTPADIWSDKQLNNIILENCSNYFGYHPEDGTLDVIDPRNCVAFDLDSLRVWLILKKYEETPDERLLNATLVAYRILSRCITRISIQTGSGVPVQPNSIFHDVICPVHPDGTLMRKAASTIIPRIFSTPASAKALSDLNLMTRIPGRDCKL